MSSSLTKTIKPVIKKLVEESWLIKEGERILIVSDFPSNEDFSSKPAELIESMVNRNILAKSIHDSITDLIPNPVELYFMEPTYEHWKNPKDKILKEKIESSNIVFTLTEYSLTDTPIVAVPLVKKQIKHISAPLIPPEVFYPGGPLDIDYDKIEELSTNLFNLFKDAKKLEFYDIAGSHLSIELPTTWLFETGRIPEYGMNTNLPPGELTLEIPYSESDCKISGQLNIFPGWQSGMSDLLILNISDNRLHDVVGGGEIGELIQNLIQKEEVKVVQFGIGTNPNAKDPFCPTVADKYSGMAHIRFHPEINTEHFYFPISKIKVDDKEYNHFQVFRNSER